MDVAYSFCSLRICCVASITSLCNALREHLVSSGEISTRQAPSPLFDTKSSEERPVHFHLQHFAVPRRLVDLRDHSTQSSNVAEMDPRGSQDFHSSRPNPHASPNAASQPTLPQPRKYEATGRWGGSWPCSSWVQSVLKRTEGDVDANARDEGGCCPPTATKTATMTSSRPSFL